MPDEFIAYIGSMVGRAIEFYSATGRNMIRIRRGFNGWWGI